MAIVVGIDASRNRSGGAKEHLVGLLGAGDPQRHGVSRVHVWSYAALLDALPNAPWLTKHNPPELERSLLRQAWWQYRELPKQAQSHRCDILLNTDAGTICGFRPAVVMSRDMLSYEPGEMKRYGFSKARLRLLILRFVQARSLKQAAGAVFLTRYAARVIQLVTKPLQHVAIIPHGVGRAFKAEPVVKAWRETRSHKVRCLYVSNVALYKHQWIVVRAIGELRKRGHNVSLVLAGGGAGRAQRLLDEEIARTDRRRGRIRVCVKLREYAKYAGGGHG
jgi:hypothetical protein